MRDRYFLLNGRGYPDTAAAGDTSSSEEVPECQVDNRPAYSCAPRSTSASLLPSMSSIASFKARRAMS